MKGDIIYKVVEKSEYEYRYSEGDIIGIDNRKAAAVGFPWFVVEKYRLDGGRYITGGLKMTKLYEYKKRYATLTEAKKALKDKKC